jgi:uncharacterized protein (TIGR03437 family)
VAARAGLNFNELPSWLMMTKTNWEESNMRTSNLPLKLNQVMNGLVCRVAWNVSLLLVCLALIVCVSDRSPMQASRSGFTIGIAPAAAQQTIACGQTLTGNITSIGQQVTYTFSANAGEAVNIAAVATSGDLAARAELFSPSNTLVGANGFGNTNTGSLTLTTTGVYTILVKDFNLNRTGAFALNLQFTTGRCGTAISCGQTLNGNIAGSAQQDTYTFSANVGEAVNIAAVAASGPLAARLELYSPSNTLVGANGFGNTNTGSLTLPVSGVYTILVRDFNLSRAGSYAINLQFTTGRCGTAIACGQTLSRNIDSIARQDTFTFTGNTGEAVNVSAVASSGGLAARAEIYSPSNSLIGANGFGNTNTGSLTLPVTGTYTILVRDFNLNRLGPYALNLQFTTGRCGTAIACGETKTGRNISGVAQQDTYTFSADAGEAVNIAAVTTAGELAARLELYSPANNLIGANGFGNTNTGSLRLPVSGVYTILVRDFNLNRTGVYAINLQFTTGRCGTQIAGGQTLSGSINSAAEQDSFVFFGREGGSVNISAVATTGALAARAEVYNPAGALVGANGFGNTSTGNLTLSVTGVHTILIRDFNLTQTGSYNVNLTCLGNACAPPVTLTLAPNQLTIAAGANSNVTATINPAQSATISVTLASSNTAVATVPASVTIPANATSASFAITGVAAGTTTITATLPTSFGGGSATASVTVTSPSCKPNSVLPSGFRPFSQVYYLTGANAGGDRLVVGVMPPAQRQLLNTVPLPDQLNQRFCDPVELAPGLLAIAYVPTANERNGDFNSFAGLLLDPVNNQPFPGGVIPANRLGDPHAWRIVNQVGGPALVNAASYSAVALASESIAAVFGVRLATGIQTATTVPLPTALAGTTVKVRDSAGGQRDAPLFFVSPDQVNFQMPPGTINGFATVTVTSGNGSVSIGTVQSETVTPGIFTANANGQGVAAGVALRVKADGTQVFEPVARFDQAQGRYVAEPIDLGPATEQVFLILFGTGMRFRSVLTATSATIGGVNAEVLFLGAQGGLVGLDQINLRVPRNLAGRGEVDVALTVDGKAANLVRVSFR